MPPNKRAKLTHAAQTNGANPSNNSDTMVAKLMERFAERDKVRYNESRAVVKSGAVNGDADMADSKEVVELSSDESSSSEEDSEDDEDDEDDDKLDEELEGEKLKAQKSQHSKEDQESVAAAIERNKAYNAKRKQREEEEQVDDDEDAEPTFGEILARDYPEEAIDVEASFEDQDAEGPSNQLVLSTGARIATTSAPNALTLTTVLRQALRTNDRDMLESCLSLEDLDSVRSTIEKLPSPLVAALLTKLAERLYRRPGRAGKLMVWVQWSLVAHGGYLTSQPEVMKMLAKLKAVINERAGALNSLLGLKGRLDMLSAQLALRQSVQRQVQSSRGGNDHEAVIYVEGEESDSSDEASDSESDEDERGRGRPLAKRIQPRNADFMDIGGPESSGDDLAMPNGIDSGSESSIGEGEEDDNLIDDEAEESEDDDGDEEESDDAFEDNIGDAFDEISEEEDEVEHIPLKRSNAAQGKSFKRR